jgi:glutamate dehydrogenase
MQQTLTDHPAVVQQLVQLFHARFDPATTAKRDEHTQTLATAIEQALEQVSSLDEDRILRRFLAIVQATIRTNFFQTDEQQRHKDYLSFKLDPARIPELPLPLPMFEIFVYSPRVEAVHLRGGLVARGGLRWSDRREDFRTEVLGLMKAQMVKNSVIVPVGSKGGFVVKRPPPAADRETLQQEVQDCYKTFIRGMLDITDNRIGNTIVPPPRVVRYDDDDPYLVVAADKGTATFSDLANSIAVEYGFWLNDAFASGGSNGYDHKKMGITARGAWESVKRHFREMGMDIQNRDDFSVVGIGDMGGDVFGNGMLLSRHIKLLAAFNHLHIFLDPDPQPEASFQERERLFQLPRSSWADYNAELISTGGGIYPRTAKSIRISPQVQAALDIAETQLTPNELIHRLLQAPVDLLWNGGIGTYVKARSESHNDAGDRANDAVRINGEELRCKVVGEGGNLGFTQLGRIEYALNGGRMLTDAIDNSAGVNCSDHEVNIKILLNQVVDRGDMTEKQRNRLLADMTDEVADLVLRQNYLQPEAISITYSQAHELLNNHVQAIRSLERAGKLNRALEYLPDDETLAERQAAGLGLVPPELAVLLAYIKITLFEELTASDVPEDSYLQRELIAYFPQPLRERFVEQMHRHPLRRDIIATYITNSMINRMGSGFLTRLREDSGETAPDIARAYSAARELYGARRLWQQIDSLDNQIASETQIKMHLESRHLLEKASLWLLRNRRPPLDIEATVAQFADGITALATALPELLPTEQRQNFEQRCRQLMEADVPQELAYQVVSLPLLYSALDLTEVAVQAKLPVDEVARVYFNLASRLDMGWLHRNIVDLPAVTQWQRRARAALLDNLYDQGRTLTADVLRQSPDEPSVAKRLEQWLQNNASVVERCLNMLADFRSSGQQPDLAMLSVALREAGNMVAGS